MPGADAAPDGIDYARETNIPIGVTGGKTWSIDENFWGRSIEGGVPVALDGERLSPLELVTRLHQIAGDNGVGRVDILEDRLLGLKVREDDECPASAVLSKPHAALESLGATAAVRKFKAMVDQPWGKLA